MDTTTSPNEYKERTWSLFSKKPMLMYSKKHDQYIVLWDGIIMTRNDAIYILFHAFHRVFPGQKVKQKLLDDYMRCLRSGVFKEFTDEAGERFMENRCRLSDMAVEDMTKIEVANNMRNTRFQYLIQMFSALLYDYENNGTTFKQAMDWLDLGQANEYD